MPPPLAIGAPLRFILPLPFYPTTPGCLFALSSPFCPSTHILLFSVLLPLTLLSVPSHPPLFCNLSSQSPLSTLLLPPQNARIPVSLDSPKAHRKGEPAFVGVVLGDGDVIWEEKGAGLVPMSRVAGIKGASKDVRGGGGGALGSRAWMDEGDEVRREGRGGEGGWGREIGRSHAATEGYLPT